MIAALRLSPLAAVLCLSIGLGLAGCDRKPKKAPAPPPPPSVGVITLSPQPTELTTVLPGRTSAYLIADVRPQVSGLITRRDFTEGSDVTAGQQLYQIDAAPYRAAYDSAMATLARNKAALGTAQSKSARYKPLAAAQAVSRQDYDDARAATGEAAADISAAKAGIETARINLAYTRVAAPISGRVGRSTVTPGALVTANQTTALATITTLDPIYVDVPQPATTLLRLKRELAEGRLQAAGPGQAAVTLKLEDGSDYPITGTLQFSEVNVDPGTGTVLLRAIFHNPDHLLLPGMFVQEQLREGVDPAALRVPQQAVSRNPHGDPTVLVVGDDDKAVEQVITLGRAVGQDWLVATGLKSGQRVIVDGLQQVKPGMQVAPRAAAAQLQPDANQPGAGTH